MIDASRYFQTDGHQIIWKKWLFQFNTQENFSHAAIENTKRKIKPIL